jgi:hypothetical protein
MNEILEYLGKVCSGMKPFLALLWSVISYILFPSDAYYTAAIGLGGAMILDILTKYYALRKPHGSIKKAIAAGSISSDNFYRGTRKKLISFLVLMILCGLSVRVAPVAGAAVFLSTLAYSVMFLREAQSCVENLLDAGHDELSWLLPVLRRRQKKIIEDEGGTVEGAPKDDSNVAG